MDISDHHDRQRPEIPVPASQWVSFEDLSDAARTGACVLFTGRRDVVQRVAYLVHTLSGWRHGPFAAAECERDAENIEQLLFDTEGEIGKADPRVAPHARLAQAGTLLLQDVDCLSAPLQGLLADILSGTHQTARPGRLRRRLMASTSEPLLPRVLAGTFDDRLFYRLNVIHLVLPDERRSRLPRQ